MTPENFVYWLEGFVEVSQTTQPTPLQWQIIQDHLDLVFNKVTPDREAEKPKETYPVIPPVKPYVPPTYCSSVNGPAVSCATLLPTGKSALPTLTIESGVNPLFAAAFITC